MRRGCLFATRGPRCNILHCSKEDDHAKRILNSTGVGGNPVLVRSLLGGRERSEPDRLVAAQAGGTVATDASGQGNHASLGGSAEFTSGLYGGGVYLDGTEAYVAIPNILTETCTLAFWFKPDWDGSDPGRLPAV